MEQFKQDLDLLIRVADLQSTESDIKTFGPRMNQFIALSQSLMTSNGISSFDEARLRRLISSSIDYYALALMRNKPMVDNTLALIGARDPQNLKPQIAMCNPQKIFEVSRFQV